MDYKTALKKASAWCSRQEYCRSDIRKKLETREVSNHDIEKVINKLVEENFIDESRFATFYVRDKFRFNRWGRKKIWWQLRQKDLTDEIINKALDQIEEMDYRQTLQKVVYEKFKQVETRDYIKKKSAMIRNAVSKGYEYQEIIPVVEQLLQNQK